jgi:hypothetical protein
MNLTTYYDERTVGDGADMVPLSGLSELAPSGSLPGASAEGRGPPLA